METIFQKRFKNRRLQLGLTLLDVAKTLNTSEATVQRYESGNIKNIPYERIVELGKILKCNPAFLMGWISPPNDELSANTNGEKEIIYSYRQLNATGKGAAKSYINDLLEIPKYTANEDNDDSDVIPIAARSGVSAVVKPSHSKEERNAALDEEFPGVSTPITPPEF